MMWNPNLPKNLYFVEFGGPCVGPQKKAKRSQTIISVLGKRTLYLSCNAKDRGGGSKRIIFHTRTVPWKN